MQVKILTKIDFRRHYVGGGAPCQRRCSIPRALSCKKARKHTLLLFSRADDRNCLVLGGGDAPYPPTPDDGYRASIVWC